MDAFDFALQREAIWNVMAAMLVAGTALFFGVAALWSFPVQWWADRMADAAFERWKARKA